MSRIDPAPVVPQAPGDLVVGGPSGKPVILSRGTDGYALTLVGGLLAYTHLAAQGDLDTTNANLATHIGNLANPHAVTKAQVGLGNVDNTSDVNKPVSTAQQTALNLKANLAGPTFTGVPAAPTAAANTNTTQIATTAFVTTADNLKANLASPTFTGTPAGPTAAPGTNTTQIATTAFVQAAVTGLAPLASPAFTGTPTAPTAAPGTNTTQLATTAFVLANAPAATWGGITGTLSSQTDLNTALTAKAPLASPTFTGTPAGPTATAGTSTTQLATTAFVTTADNLKENTIAAGTSAQYWRGDKTWQTLNAAAVGLGNVNNTADTAKQSSSALEFVIYNGGAVITTGVPDYCDMVVPFACTITSWTLLGSATCTIDVWKAPYASYPPSAANSIVGAGTKPNIASGFSGQSSTLTSWTTSISAGDIIRLNVTAASGSLIRATLILNVTRTAV